MKLLFSFFLFILTTNAAFACLSASQNRLFPLGKTAKGLIVVETHLHRTEFRANKNEDIIELKPAWVGQSYLKIYDHNHKEIYSKLLDTIRLFEQKNYVTIIGKTVEKGLNLAKKQSGFVAAKPVKITFCDYQETCNSGALVFDTKKNKISVRLKNKIEYQIKLFFDPTSIASNLLHYYSGFDDFDVSAKGLKGSLYINSVRQFQIGDKKLTVVHIGTGQAELTRKEHKPGFEFKEVAKSVFDEPVLHHGHGFDFFIWE